MPIEYLKALYKEIIIFVVSISMVAFIIIASKSYWDNAVADNTAAIQRLDKAKRKHRDSIDRKEILKEYKSRYDKLEKASIVGDENRVDWINLLEQIAKNKKIPFINYKIDKQVIEKNALINSNYPGLDMYKSIMTLEMRLLHEGDLYTIIEDLKLSAKGLFDVSSCEMKRIQNPFPSILDNNRASNFSANCKLNWYTFKSKSA